MRLTRFGTYDIPQYSKKDTLDTGASGGALASLPGGGAFDGWGAETAGESPFTVSTQFELIDTTVAGMQSQRDAVRALRGQMARLWATMPDGSVRFVWARCSQVRMERQWQYNFYQPIELAFEIKSPGWNGIQHGPPWVLDDGEYLDTGLYLDVDDKVTLNVSPKTTTVNNAGNRDVTDAQLTISAVSASIGSVRIQCGDTDWTYTGTIAAGTALVVDCGTRSVLKNNVNAYSGFVLGANHADEAWFRLVPGNNSVIITLDGVDSGTHTASFLFWDKWN